MPKIAELKKIDDEIWARIDADWNADGPISLLTEPEVQAIRKDEREGVIEVVRWFSNIEKFTADDIIRRIRSVSP